MDSYNGKKVLLIGSSNDIDGRAMHDSIDGELEYDFIARVNRYYGAADDCGSRTDLIFVRHREWATFYFQRADLCEGCRIVAFWDGVGCDRSFADDVASEVGLPKASTGLLAAKWLLDRGADVTVIGFGYSDGSFATAKTYAVTGMADANPNYDWPSENEWLRQNVTLI